MDIIAIEDLYGRDENGDPKIPEEELIKKLNEIITWINDNE